MTIIETPRLRFPARCEGPVDGRPVLLLHGFPQSSHEWRAQLRALGAAGYRAVAYDQRGYSPDACPPEVGEYRMEELVADLLAVADAIGAERFDVVGHDWGGAVAWHVAGRHAERVRTLTAVSTPHPWPLQLARRSGGPQREMSSYIQVFRQPVVAEDFLLEDNARRLRDVFATSGLTDYQPYLEIHTRRKLLTGGLNWYRAATAADAENVGTIAVPTLFVWGTDDTALGREAAEGTASMVSGPYRFVALDGVGHWVPETAADRLNTLLLAHLGAY
jgi:pimeloyl-ACP methyl ester carboxylesterase